MKKFFSLIATLLVLLAAVAIGGGIHVALVFALAGVLQAVGPVVAHLHGARRDGEGTARPAAAATARPGRCQAASEWAC